MKMKIMITVAALCLLAFLVSLYPPSSVVASQSDQKTTVANIDLFGYANTDVEKLRSVLPIKTGESIKLSEWSAYRSKIEDAIRSLTGKVPTDVSLACCNEQANSVIYIGLPGTSSVVVQHKPAPTGDVRLPAAALKLSQEADEALTKAVLAGRTQQDNSNGYSLSVDPDLRAKELQIREFALANEDVLRNILLSSSEAEHRAITAEFLGYVNVSARQIADLAEASRDPDPGVRNNAVRALGVIAGSSQQRASMIPPAPFIALLKSGKWVDRNKGGWLMISLTASRDPKLLKQLRSEAMDALVEMARWQFVGHASSARRLLGRIAGIEEARLDTLINDQAEAIIAAANLAPLVLPINERDSANNQWHPSVTKDLFPGCPTISVSCPSGVEPNKPIRFEASIIGGKPNTVMPYGWSVSKGKITFGQGTAVIEVDVTGVGPKGLTATVEVSGFHPECPRVASCTIASH